jgi:hypothetical protein
LSDRDNTNKGKKQYKGKLDEKANKYLTFFYEAPVWMKILLKDFLDHSGISKGGFQIVAMPGL